MKKSKASVIQKIFNLFGIIILFSVPISCSDEKDDDTILAEEIVIIKNMVEQESLLVDIRKGDEETTLEFETHSITIPNDHITVSEINRELWKTTLIIDGISLDVPTLGTSISTEKIELNPTGYAPLSLKVQYSFKVRGKMKMRIESKDDIVPDFTHEFSNYGYNHTLDIHGLYPNYMNIVYITLTDKNGKERLTDTLKIQTEDISNIIKTETNILKIDYSKMEPGMILVNSSNQSFEPHRSYMIDAMGNIRWIVIVDKHPVLMKLNNTGNGFRRSQNGNFITGSRENSMIYEISMFGDLVNQWDIGLFDIGFHHDIIELPNMNILFAATKFGDTKANGDPATLDYFVEIDRNTGAIVSEWDIKQSLDETRDLIRVEGQAKSNWAHGNAVCYIEDEDAIVVSLRYQGVVKLDRKNKVKWILAPHRGFTVNGRGEVLKNFLLIPKDVNNNLIENQNVVNGLEKHENFDYPWSQHSTVIMPNGNLLVYDNGYSRNFDKNGDKYSRIVIYDIDEVNGTVRQVWEYGKDRPELYCNIGGASIYLPQTGNVLFGSGNGINNSYGRKGGRIIQINPQNNEVVWEIEINEPKSGAFHYVSSMGLYP